MSFVISLPRLWVMRESVTIGERNKNPPTMATHPENDDGRAGQRRRITSSHHGCDAEAGERDADHASHVGKPVEAI